jgi:hypothetical protein
LIVHFKTPVGIKKIVLDDETLNFDKVCFKVSVLYLKEIIEKVRKSLQYYFVPLFKGILQDFPRVR